MTVAVASKGDGLGPETGFATRRVVGLRRAEAMTKSNKGRINKIMMKYEEKEEPGIHKDEEQSKVN